MTDENKNENDEDKGEHTATATPPPADPPATPHPPAPEHTPEHAASELQDTVAQLAAGLTSLQAQVTELTENGKVHEKTDPTPAKPHFLLRRRGK